MTTTEEDTQYISTGGTVPIFSGKMEDYDTWREDIDDWALSTKIKPEAQVARLTYPQLEVVKKVIRKVPKDKRNSPQGLEKVLEVMETQFKKPSELLSRPTFTKWENMRRQKGETTEQFMLNYELTFHELQKHDIEVQCSERLLALKALDRLEIEPDKQAQILSAVKGPLTTRAIVATVESLYKTDVPWSPQTSAPSFKKKSFEIDSASSEMDKALVHDEMHDDPENEEAYYLSKGKGKGTGYNPNISCQRCGKRGHPSHLCRLSWEQAQKSLAANPIKATDVALSAFTCPKCHHPDCEGDDAASSDASGWEYASDASNDATGIPQLG